MKLKYILNKFKGKKIKTVLGFNPKVQCWFYINFLVLGFCNTLNGGRPHSESLALSEICREKFINFYIFSEPCVNFGKTPPCSYLLLNKNIKYIVVYNIDIYNFYLGWGIKLIIKLKNKIFYSKFYFSFYIFKNTKCSLNLNSILGFNNKKLKISFDKFNVLLRIKSKLYFITINTIKVDNSKLISLYSNLDISPIRLINNLNLTLNLNLIYLSSHNLLLCNYILLYKLYKIRYFGIFYFQNKKIQNIIENGYILSKFRKIKLILISYIYNIGNIYINQKLYIYKRIFDSELEHLSLSI